MRYISVTFDRAAFYIGPFDRACFCLSKLSKNSNFVFGAVSRVSSFHATYKFSSITCSKALNEKHLKCIKAMNQSL